MRLLYLNPNSTEAMTHSVVAVARAALPGHEVLGWTNTDGPPAIQGPEDGEAAIPGLLALLPRTRAEGVDAIVIACFDDTGLARLRALAHCPVLGIGQSAFHVAALLGGSFAVVTTLAVSVPVIADNIAAAGFGPACVGVRASGLPVLEVEAGGPAVEDRLASEIAAAARDGAQSVILGCAGMAALLPALGPRAPLPLIDGVRASAHLAAALVGYSRSA